MDKLYTKENFRKLLEDKNDDILVQIETYENLLGESGVVILDRSVYDNLNLLKKYKKWNDAIEKFLADFDNYIDFIDFDQLSSKLRFIEQFDLSYIEFNFDYTFENLSRVHLCERIFRILGWSVTVDVIPNSIIELCLNGL